jgi:hypothetical protein
MNKFYAYIHAVIASFILGFETNPSYGAALMASLASIFFMLEARK